MHLRDILSKYGILFALIVLVLIAGILSPAFLKVENITNIFWQTSYIGIIAVGMTFIMIGGGIDLSVGSFAALMGALAIQTVNALGDTTSSVILSILITIAVGALLGAGSGLLVTKGRIPPFVVTLGAMAIYRSLVLNFANGGVYMSRSSKYSSIGMMRVLGLPVPMIVFLIYVVVASIILERTKFGRYVYAIGANETAALYSAINVDRIRTATYVIGGISVSISAVLLSSMMSSVSSSSTGNGFELDAIAAAVIGGTSLSGGRGTILGTFLGALVLGVINNMLVMLNVAVYLQGLVKGLIIISAVFIQNLRTND
ncbi:MAG TPA: ABC transporter permease [Fervidobacterium sp.]|nr:ribose ABC transporter permease [Fervidobacterium sp.]HOK87708.1 ABC transporter permease [Fervidobacterium sp.]HOM74047.1 ABC transporter permease [Fervidobacterium sp.]HPP17694.1 ABC transporter permease [Fervidobacterium sp.]HRD20269.1 ABC transporter permease [Fervidobacterium sp.]